MVYSTRALVLAAAALRSPAIVTTDWLVTLELPEGAVDTHYGVKYDYCRSITASAMEVSNITIDNLALENNKIGKPITVSIFTNTNCEGDAKHFNPGHHTVGDFKVGSFKVLQKVEDKKKVGDKDSDESKEKSNDVEKDKSKANSNDTEKSETKEEVKEGESKEAPSIESKGNSNEEKGDAAEKAENKEDKVEGKQR